MQICIRFKAGHEIFSYSRYSPPCSISVLQSVTSPLLHFQLNCARDFLRSCRAIQVTEIRTLMRRIIVAM